jgi:hypothetical protein
MAVIRSSIRDAVGAAPPTPICFMPLGDNLSLPIGVGAATFTRSTTGQYTDPSDGLIKTAAIDTARFEANGVLIEGASTNLLLHSRDFTDPSWSTTGVSVIGNTDISPDGVSFADTLRENAVSNIHNIENTATVSTGEVTETIYAKIENGTRYLVLRPLGIGNGKAFAAFDLVNGGVFNTGGVEFVNAKIEPAAFGYYRVSLTGDYAVAPTGFSYQMSQSGVESEIYAGDGTSGFYIWQAQGEELPFATSPIYTDASPVTRTADNLSIDADNYPLIQNPTTVSVEVDVLGYVDINLKEQVIFASGTPSQGLLGESIYFNDGNNFTAFDRTASGNYPFTPVAGITYKYAKTSDGVTCRVYENGSEKLSFSSGSDAGNITTDFQIGRVNDATRHLYGHIKNLKIFDQELSARQVVQL